MPSLRSLEGLVVYDRKGKAVGRVSRVLCHPSDPVVVGVEVQPPNVAYVVSRGPRYIALRGLELGEDGLDEVDLKAWSGGRAEKELGFEWEQTVIWMGMPLVSESGKKLGYVRDASFTLPDGQLGEVLVSQGLTSDVAVGTRQFDGSLLIGFDGSAVRSKDEVATAEYSGGAAAKAGANVGVAKVVVSETAKTAAAVGGKAMKAAAASKPAKSAWAVLRETGKAFREGMADDDKK